MSGMKYSQLNCVITFFGSRSFAVAAHGDRKGDEHPPTLQMEYGPLFKTDNA